MKAFLVGGYMIKNTIVFYIKSLKYIFIPIITLVICALIGFGVLYLGAKIELDNFSLDLTNNISNLNLDVNKLLDYIISSIKELSWDNPFETIKLIVQEDWLNLRVTEFISMANEGYSGYQDQILNAINSSMDGFKVYLIIFVILIVLGFLSGYFITSSLIRKKFAERSLKRTILVSIVDAILSATLVAFITYLTGIWVNSIFISSLISILVYGLVTLLEAYLGHRNKKMKMEKIVTFKNVVLLLVSDLLILVITIAVIYLLFLIPAILVSLLFTYALVVIAFLTISLAAEVFVTNSNPYKKK